ncbi:MAG: YggS family pyridoxal phosphate-dependent enzyme [Flavobacteriaceae bacterium]|nr:YggS family pyridoxal phosphate-dependent enzyme [Flavobacteriaceae bacterium]
MKITYNLHQIKINIPSKVTIVAVSKTKTREDILEAYHAGHRDFGENRVQELVSKQSELPKDINWHMVGHLQSNKVKYIAPIVSLIHSIDSLKLLKEVNRQAMKCKRIIPVLIQVKIAQEVSKFGLEIEKIDELITLSKQFRGTEIKGLMGMASFTSNRKQLISEFKSLKTLFDKLKTTNTQMDILSMGMTQDYLLAITQGSTMVRIGRKIFGERIK